MMRRSPPLFRPTRHYESSSHAPSGTIAAFGVWLEMRGAGVLISRAVRGGRVGERRLADERVAVILRNRAAAAGVAPFTPGDMRRTYISELLDAGADLASVQKVVAYGSATAMAGYDRRGDATRRRAADLVHVPFSRGSLSERRQYRSPPAHPAENQHYRLRVTMLERKLVSGCGPKRVRSLFGRMDSSKRTVGGSNSSLAHVQ
jgi:hypothetical protein